MWRNLEATLFVLFTDQSVYSHTIKRGKKKLQNNRVSLTFKEMRKSNTKMEHNRTIFEILSFI